MQPTNPKSQPLVLPNENNPTADISHSQFLSTRDKARGRYLLVFVLGAVLVSQWPNSFEVNIQLSFHFSQHLVSQVQKNRKKKKKKNTHKFFVIRFQHLFVVSCIFPSFTISRAVCLSTTFRFLFPFSFFLYGFLGFFFSFLGQHPLLVLSYELISGPLC